MRRLILAFALAPSACGGNLDDSQSTPAPGVVSVRFVNPTAADVFINATYGAHWFSQADKPLPDRHDCTPLCGASCECSFCGAPQNVVRRIPPSGVWEISWSGSWYELVEQCGGGQCNCDRARSVPFGSTRVEIVGALGRNPADADPMPSDPELFLGMVDSSAGTCTGAATFELDAQPKSVDVPFVCTQ
jgi:hypothetical protein